MAFDGLHGGAAFHHHTHGSDEIHEHAHIFLAVFVVITLIFTVFVGYHLLKKEQDEHFGRKNR